MENVSRRNLAQLWGTRVVNYIVQDREIPLQLQNGRPLVHIMGSPRLLTLSLQLARPGDLRHIVKLSEELALAVGAEHCRVYRFFGQIMIEIQLPPQLWSVLHLRDMNVKGGLWLTLGKTSRMTDVYCKLDGNTIAPIICVGRTGSGKSELLKSLTWQLSSANRPEDVKITVFDPKNKFGPIGQLPHLALPLLHTHNEGMHAIGWLLSQVQRRMETGQRDPRIVFVVDELPELMVGDFEDAGKGLGRIASLGRELGIHMILASQRADRRHLDALSSANVGLRLVGQVASTTEATIAAGQGGSGAHLLSGEGDFLSILGTCVHRTQIALISPEQFESLPRRSEDNPLPDLIHYDVGSLLRMSGDGPAIPKIVSFEPDELATALTGVGILKLKRLLSMGQRRATRLRRKAVSILDKLGKMGYYLAKQEGRTYETKTETSVSTGLRERI